MKLKQLTARDIEVTGYGERERTFQVRPGYLASVRIDSDDCMGAPWKERDGHGIVSEWERRDKRPGELILCEDHGSKRFYDFAASVKIARRDGWNTSPYDIPGETAGARAHRATMADYNYLRRWAEGDWYYVVVICKVYHVTPGDDDSPELVLEDSCGGIETYKDYQLEHAADWINYSVTADIELRARAELSELREAQERAHWAARDVNTAAL